MTSDHTSPRWRKSSYSGDNGGDCVETALDIPGSVAVRNSKDPDGPQLHFPHHTWTAFLTALKTGEITSR